MHVQILILPLIAVQKCVTPWNSALLLLEVLFIFLFITQQATYIHLGFTHGFPEYVHRRYSKRVFGQ